MIDKVVVLYSLFFILAAVTFGIYLARIKDAGKKKWNLLLYLAVTGILIGLISLLGLIEFTRLPLWLFIAAQVWALIIGSIHAFFFEKIIPLENKIFGSIIFTLSLCFFGYGLMLLSFDLYINTPFPRFYFIPSFFFIAPVFIITAFGKFVEIPDSVFKAWEFPSPGTLPDPSDSEMANPIIVNFEIRKQCADNRTVFKAKAPKGMQMGKLFYFFIMDYNSRHPDNPILIIDSDGKPFKWSFCMTASILKGRIRLDPELTISKNGLKENTSVICERIKP